MNLLDPVCAPFVAKITGKTYTSGVWYYDWEEYQGQYNAVSRVQASPGRQGSDTVSPAFEINNTEVDVDTFVLMYGRGFVNGQFCYEFVAPDTSGSGLPDGTITVGEYGTSPDPDIADVAALRFYVDDGFSVTSPGSGSARVALLPASMTQKGIITDAAQSLPGEKTFAENLYARYKIIAGLDILLGATFMSSPVAGDPLTALGLLGVSSNQTRLGILDGSTNAAYGYGGIQRAAGADVPPGGYGIRFFIYDVGIGASYTGKYHTSVFGDVYKGGILTTAASSYNLDNLSDVTAPTPSNLDVLQWNGSAWVNVPASGLVTTATIADGDKGDITVSGSGATWTIDNDVVTYAKLQNVSATSRILGRKTSGAGDAEECTLSEVLDFVGSAAQGDILYRGAATWTRLGAGTAGYVLQTGGAGANPSWVAQTTAYTDEMARDAIGTALTAGLGIGITVNDGADTITVATSLIGVRGHATSNQTIGNSTPTGVLCDGENYDTHGFHSTSIETSKFTVPTGKAGYYLIQAQATWDQIATARVYGILTVNGTTGIAMDDQMTSSSHYTRLRCSTVYYLNAGDYIQFVMNQSTGSSKNLINGVSGRDSWVALTYLGN